MYKFKHEYEPESWETINLPHSIEVSINTKHTTLEDMCEHFTYFLKGCGFNFAGRVEIVQEEEEKECTYE